MTTDRNVSRRRYVGSLMALGAGAALTACSSAGKNAPVSSSGSASSSGIAHGASASSSGSVAVSAAPGSTHVPTKAEILERFDSRVPKSWALNLPGETTHVPADGHAVALTFDACGGRGGDGYDEKLIELLRTHNVKATLMLNSRWIAANESIAKELAADPLFRLGNHGVTHRPLSTTKRSAYGIAGTGSLSALYDEVRGAHDWIVEHQPGTTPYFRSGTAYSDDIGVDVCAAMGSPFLGFSLNGDAGATYTAPQIKRTLLRVKAGDVVISHMNQPTHATAEGYASVLPQLLDHGVTFHHVS